MLGLTSLLLTGLSGQETNFSANRASVMYFVKEDCPTYRTVMPVLAAMYKAFADNIDFHIIGQTAEGNRQLVEEFDLPFYLLDDSRLKKQISE